MSTSDNLLLKRRAPARPPMKTAISPPHKSNVQSATSPQLSMNAQPPLGLSQTSSAPLNTKEPLQQKGKMVRTTPPGATSALMAARIARDYEKKKYSPLCITRMPQGYHTSKISLIQELRAKSPNMYDLLFILTTRSKAANERDPNDLTVLQLACSAYAALTISHRISFCRQLLRLYPKAATQRDSDGQTALHHALQVTPSPSLRLVRTLLTADATCAKIKDNAGCLPLHAAIMGTASNAIIKMLVLCYPEAISIADGSGTTALEYVQSRMKEPSEATVALLSVEGVWRRPDVILSVDIMEPDPEEVYAATFLQTWYRKTHAPKVLTCRRALPIRRVQPTSGPVLSAWSHEAATTIQALVRGVCLRKRIAIGTMAIIFIQRILRGCLTRGRLHNTMSSYRAMALRQRSRRMGNVDTGRISVSSHGRGVDNGSGWDMPDRHTGLHGADEDYSAGEDDADAAKVQGSEGGGRDTVEVPASEAITHSNSAMIPPHNPTTAPPPTPPAPNTSTTDAKKDAYLRTVQCGVLPALYEVLAVLGGYTLLLLWMVVSVDVGSFLQNAHNHSTTSTSVVAKYVTSTSASGPTGGVSSFVLPFGGGSLPVLYVALLCTVLSFVCVMVTLQLAKQNMAHCGQRNTLPPKSARVQLANYTIGSVVSVTITWAIFALWLDAHWHAVLKLFTTFQGVSQPAFLSALVTIPIAPVLLYPFLLAYYMTS